jgi:hypothetical protein
MLKSGTMTETEQNSLIRKALTPILYADIFDYPLTFEEVYKFLEFETTPEEVERLLGQAVANNQLVLVDGYYSLVHKPHLAVRRRERRQVSQSLWPKAIGYGRWIASLPFVRMVSVTGALAVDNPRDGVDDIDYLIVTQSKRLWLCRALIILMVRYGHRRGVNLCPNYLITENVLYFEDDNLFVAREMVQMIPLYGKEAYLKIRQVNDWVTDYLPQGNGLNLDKINDQLSPGQSFLKRLAEFFLRGFLGDLLEQILQKVQITKHSRIFRTYGAADKVIFSADVCKGHYDGHNNKIMKAYRQRLQNYSVNGRVRN